MECSSENPPDPPFKEADLVWRKPIGDDELDRHRMGRLASDFVQTRKLTTLTHPDLASPSGQPPSSDSSPKVRILILKLGALGDVVRTSYILPGLHQRFGPGTTVTWVTASSALPILRFNPYVSELLTIEQTGTPAGARDLGTHEFDWVISLDDEIESCGIATQVKARRISGAFVTSDEIHYTEDTRPWFDMGLISRFGKTKADQLKLENQKSHDAIFAEMLDLAIERPSFFNNPRSEALGRTMLRHLPRKIVGLNLSAGKRWPSKSLRLEEAIGLIGHLKEMGATCLLLGGIDDAAYLESIASITGCPSINGLTLDEFAGVIRGLDLLVTSDTLALHLAIAQGVPNLSYYAPTSAVEINTFGTGSQIASLSPDYCSYRPDADNSTITAERLLPEAQALLAKGGVVEAR